MGTSEILYHRIKGMVAERHTSINKMLNACGLNTSLMTDVKNKGTIPSAEKIGKTLAGTNKEAEAVVSQYL